MLKVTEYTLIDPGDAPFRAVLGDSGDSLQRHIMLGTECRAGEPLREGQWEHRLFANGAIALVFRDSDSRIQVRNELGDVILASPEAISLSMNLLALKDHRQWVPDSLIPRLDAMYIALKEALIQDRSTLILSAPGAVLSTRKPQSSGEGRVKPHREARSIIQMEG